MESFSTSQHSTDSILLHQQTDFTEFNNNHINSQHQQMVRPNSENSNMNPNQMDSTSLSFSQHLQNGHPQDRHQQSQGRPQQLPQYDAQQYYQQQSSLPSQQQQQQQQQKRKKNNMVTSSNGITTTPNSGNHMNIRKEVQDVYGIPENIPLNNTSPNGNFSNLSRNPKSQQTQNMHIPTQDQWSAAQLNNESLSQNSQSHPSVAPPNSTITPQMAAAIMGGRENVSQRQMAQLKQLQSTYGSLQNHLSKPAESDMNLKKIPESMTFSPTKASIPINNLNYKGTNHNTLSLNSKLSDNFGSSPNPMISTLADVKTGSDPKSQLPTQAVQGKYPMKMSSQSPNVTTPHQEPFNPQQQKAHYEQYQQQQVPINQRSSTNSLYNLQQPAQQGTFAAPQPPPTAPHSQHPHPQPQSYDAQNEMSEEVKRNLSNIAIVRLLRFNDLLTSRQEKPSLPYLRKVVSDFFTEDAMFIVCLKCGNEKRNYKLSYSMLPLLVLKCIENVQMFEFSQKFLQTSFLADGSILLSTDNWSFKCVFDDGSYCNHFGSIRVKINKNLLFERLEMVTDYNVDGIAFAALEKFLNAFDQNSKNNSMPSSLQIKSHFQYISNLTKFGIDEGLLRLLQIGDVMTLATPLINFYADSKFISPLDALDAFNKVNFPALQKLHSIYSKNSRISSQPPPQSSQPHPQPHTSSSVPLSRVSSNPYQNMADPQQFNLVHNSDNSPYGMPVQQGPPNQFQYAQNGQMKPNQARIPYSNGYLNNSAPGMMPVDPSTSKGIKSNPLKRQSSDNSVAQIVTRKVNKKFKLQAPPVPNKSSRKSKGNGSAKNDNSNNNKNAKSSGANIKKENPNKDRNFPNGNGKANGKLGNDG